MKKIISLLLFALLTAVTFTACTKSTPDISADISLKIPDELQSVQSYLMDEDRFRRIETSDGEYLLAFYGRYIHEPFEKNRIIYINKFSEVVYEFEIPEEFNRSETDFYFGEKYVMMLNRQYCGVDIDGNMHGITVVSTDGTVVADYPSRDPHIFTGVDRFTRLNRISYGWCEKDSETFLFNTPFAIYEYNIPQKSLKKVVGIEQIVADFDFKNQFADVDSLDIFGGKYGFLYLFWSDVYGMIFSVNDTLETDSVQYNSSEGYTLYFLNGNELTQVTEKDTCTRNTYFDSKSNVIVRIDPNEHIYLLNEEPSPQYNIAMDKYSANIYARNNNLTPLIVGTETSSTELTLHYYDITNNVIYDGQTELSNISTVNGVFDFPYYACEEYVYMAAVGGPSDMCYRLNCKTGEGTFVYGNVESPPFCPEYRIHLTRVIDSSMIKVQICKDYTL